MGRKQASRKKRAWRNSEAAAAVMAAVGEASREATARSRSNAELFVVDRAATTFAQRSRAARRATVSSLAADGASDAAAMKKAARARASKAKPKGAPAPAAAVTADLWSTGGAPAVNTVKPRLYMGLTRPSQKKKRRREQNLGNADAAFVHPAVRIADEGSSYNPGKEAHENALGEAVAAEVVLDEERQRLEREKPQGVPVRMPGDSDDESESEEEEDYDSEEEAARSSALVTARGSGLARALHSMRPVTTRQRNKRRRHAERSAKLIAKKRAKKLEDQIGQLANMVGIVNGEERGLAKRKSQRVEEARLMKLHNESVAPMPKAGGKAAPHLVRPMAMEVLLRGEIPSSLSRLKPLSGPSDLLRERQISLLSRGKFEMGGRRSVKSRKQKSRARKALSSNKARWSIQAMINSDARAPNNPK